MFQRRYITWQHGPRYLSLVQNNNGITPYSILFISGLPPYQKLQPTIVPVTQDSGLTNTIEYEDTAEDNLNKLGPPKVPAKKRFHGTSTPPITLTRCQSSVTGNTQVIPRYCYRKIRCR